jgi:hypothetical protein
MQRPFPEDYDHEKSHKRWKNYKLSKGKKKGWAKWKGVPRAQAQPDSMYLPAVIALRGSDAEQDIADDTEDMGVDQSAQSSTLDIQINGMMFSTRKIQLENLTLNGAIVGRRVDLQGNYNVTFDPKYISPTPPYVEVIIGYSAGPVTWSE